MPSLVVKSLTLAACLVMLASGVYFMALATTLFGFAMGAVLVILGVVAGRDLLTRT